MKRLERYQLPEQLKLAQLDGVLTTRQARALLRLHLEAGLMPENCLPVPKRLRGPWERFQFWRTPVASITYH